MRPIIGIVLGSGAARGWTHIGILEGLAALGIVPQIVSGTSIGALVGAAFATGKLDELRKRIQDFRRRDVAALLDVRLSAGGLIEGRRIDNFLDGLGIVGGIESFGTRFGAVATDLETGREIWLQSGAIGSAVRASIGMPGVFSPALKNDGTGWLIDGGLINPVPVSLARALGADVVIAVDLNSELVGRRFQHSDMTDSGAAVVPAIPEGAPQWLKESVSPLLQRMFQAGPNSPSYFEVLANALNIMQDRITRMRLAGDPPDVLLHPRLGQFSWLDFHRAKEAIAAGMACVGAAKASIQQACRIT